MNDASKPVSASPSRPDGTVPLHEGEDDAVVVVLRDRVLQAVPQFFVVQRRRGFDQRVNLVREHLDASGVGDQLGGGGAAEILGRRFLHRRDGLGIDRRIEGLGRQVVAVLGGNGEGGGDHAGQDHQDGEDHLGHGGNERRAAGGAHVSGRHRALHDEEVRAPVAEGEHEPEPEHHRKPVHAHRVGVGPASNGFQALLQASGAKTLLVSAVSPRLAGCWATRASLVVSVSQPPTSFRPR